MESFLIEGLSPESRPSLRDLMESSHSFILSYFQNPHILSAPISFGILVFVMCGLKPNMSYNYCKICKVCGCYLVRYPCSPSSMG